MLYINQKSRLVDNIDRFLEQAIFIPDIIRAIIIHQKCIDNLKWGSDVFTRMTLHYIK